MTTNGPAPQPVPAGDKSAIDSTVEYLILEIVRYYSIGQDLVAAVHAVETMGFRIGYQLAERLTEGMERMDEPLVKMKFICRDFWTALFGRQAGGLKTNHKGRFVIDDPNLPWLTPLKSSLAEPSRGAADGEGPNGSSRQRVADLYITLAAGCLKGALFHLNCTCVVSGTSSRTPACASFTIDMS